MTVWHLRDFVAEDLERAVALDEASSTTSQPPVFPLADVVSALNARHPAVVAVAGGHLVGSAVSRVEGDRAWVLRLALAPDWRGRGLGSALLSALEHRLLGAGVRHIAALLPEDETGSAAFTNSGFVPRRGISYYEKLESVTPYAASLLAALGGSVPPSGLWDHMSGMHAEKFLIERRVVLPLARRQLAEEHGVDPPRAIILFGPPGTGKTTFARAIASRLSWPFVELFPSRLAGSEGGLPAGLSAAFAQIAELERVVVFIDEVEEIAAVRGTGSGGPGVVNELLKALVSFRERPERLLVCATNSVRLLDPAFLRHGRFDYVLPIGPPDLHARDAMWRVHLESAGAGEHVERAELVRATEGFTAADIAHAARRAAQRQFERTVDDGRRRPAQTADYLQCIEELRPTLTPEMAEGFREDIERFARQ